MNISKIRAVITTTAVISLLSFQNVRADVITDALATPTAVATPAAVTPVAQTAVVLIAAAQTVEVLTVEVHKVVAVVQHLPMGQVRINLLN